MPGNVEHGKIKLHWQVKLQGSICLLSVHGFCSIYPTYHYKPLIIKNNNKRIIVGRRQNFFPFLLEWTKPNNALWQRMLNGHASTHAKIECGKDENASFFVVWATRNDMIKNEVK